MSRQKGFTLIELLVVISIIVLLAAMLIPALNKVRDLANRASCASQIHQHVMAMMMYADDNNNKLPDFGGLIYWIWDVPVKTCDMILKGGVTKETFYCPSNRQQQRHIEDYWTFAEPDYRVTGYFWMIDVFNRQGVSTRDPIEGSGNKKWLKDLNIKNAADAELVMDAIISDAQSFGPPDYPNGNFERILCGGMPDNPNVGYDASSHIKKPSEAAGGNMGFADGHTKWRPFNEMERRLGPGCPYHWW